MEGHNPKFDDMYAAAEGDQVVIKKAKVEALAQEVEIPTSEALHVVEGVQSDSEKVSSPHSPGSQVKPESNLWRDWEIKQDEDNERRFGPKGLRPEDGPDFHNKPKP